MYAAVAAYTNGSFVTADLLKLNLQLIMQLTNRIDKNYISSKFYYAKHLIVNYIKVKIYMIKVITVKIKVFKKH